MLEVQICGLCKRLEVTQGGYVSKDAPLSNFSYWKVWTPTRAPVEGFGLKVVHVLLTSILQPPLSLNDFLIHWVCDPFVQNLPATVYPEPYDLRS